jgi:hypothetical protein
MKQYFEGSIPLMIGFTLMTATFLAASMHESHSIDYTNQSSTTQDQDSQFLSSSQDFSVNVPEGWIIQEIDNTNTHALLNKIMQGSRLLAVLCPIEQAMVDSDGKYSCDEFKQSIQLNYYPDLNHEPEFSSDSAANKSDNLRLLDYHISKLKELGYSDINVIHDTMTTINTVDVETNKITAIVPANLIEMTYNNTNSNQTRGFFLLATKYDTASTEAISGYILSYQSALAAQPSGSPTESIAQIFRSFQLVDHKATDKSSFLQDSNSHQYQKEPLVINRGLPQYLDEVISPPTDPPENATLNARNSTSNFR